jgi:5-(carboxyamino)imidazole ribonucleotide synthase
MNMRLGIIGGGQLGLYLCEAAQALGFQVAIISDTADAAALQKADRSFVAALDSVSALDEFLLCCDVVTFEKEDVPDETLAHLIASERAGAIAIYPGAASLKMLKDKAQQKTWLQENNLPTLPFHTLPGVPFSVDVLVSALGQKVVQKVRCGGYDGRGVQLLEALHSPEQLWDVPSIVEPLLIDSHEISVITARDCSGNLQSYPPVSMTFDAQLNSVSVVAIPASIRPELADRAVELAELVVSLLGGVGVFAVEMFITPADELLINEISPRVHNSGHVTLDACNVSQFEQHVRAVMGLPLVKVVNETPAVMLNILYSEGMRGSCPDKPVVRNGSQRGTSVYWYGKAPGLKGRKMGHINALAARIPAAVAMANHTMIQLTSDRDNEDVA